MDNGSPNKYSIPIADLVDFAVNEYLNRDRSRLGKLKKVSSIGRSKNKRALFGLSQQLLDDLEPYKPMLQKQTGEAFGFDSPEMEHVKSIVIDFMLEIDNRKLLFDRSFIKFFIEQGYMDVAQEFILRARADDAQLATAEIFQAMRNVWIMNSLQIFWGLPLEMTPSVYAYSLLYPYTDNYLDNPDVDREAKIEFNARLSRVLNGEKLAPASFVEEKVFSLVGQIESQYARETFPGVFDSLRLIQDAQTESMRQDRNERLTYDEVLPVSFFKGGTSVLADAFLVKGNLDLMDMRFAFAYGSFLQLVDDLQDAAADRENHHQTLFSIENEDKRMDDEVSSLISFVFQANAPDETDTPIMSLMKEIISACTLAMVMDAAGRNPDLISHRFYKVLESRSKVSLSFYKEFEERFKDLTSETGLK